MATVHFITHPEVVIDPAIPVPEWPLSAVGVRRVGLLLAQPWVKHIRAVFSSAERKAADTARMIADDLALTPVVIDGLGENDRSSTGYLPKAAFEALADAFFARPEESVRGCERAIVPSGGSFGPWTARSRWLQPTVTWPLYRTAVLARCCFAT